MIRESIRKGAMRLGCGVAIQRDGKYLVSRRREGSRSQVGKWQFPGGSVEEGELIFEAMQRETLEETGLDLDRGRFMVIAHKRLPRGDGTFYHGSLFVLNLRNDEELPANPEPEKHTSWEWKTLEEIAALEMTPWLAEQLLEI